MKQTAVEWLGLYIKGITTLNCDDILEQAKEMEKEQMNLFFYKGDSYSCSCYKSPTDKDFKQYYNETFKK